MTLKDINKEERPRERLAAKGAYALSNAELMAILLRTGGMGRDVVSVARELLGLAGDLTTLSMMSLDKMTEVRGIGKDKAIAVAAAFELGRRLAVEKTGTDSRPITNARQAFELLLPVMKGLDHEECWVIYMNRANRVTAKEKMSSGGQTGTVLDNGIIIRKALEKKALGMILAHNHPSGSPYPGQADIRQTQELKKASSTFGISLIDHIIICDSCFYSFADEQASYV
ncbi:MAG: DNA repair protein RadC [Candidatus Cryptobacteroides sp.]